MNKKIKINFCGFWTSFKKNDNLFFNILSKHFDVEISERPDYVICSNRGEPFEYMKYDCVRIMFMGENMSPDFTVFDYVIGFDYITFGDRYFRLPFALYFDDGHPWIPEAIDYNKAVEILKQKKHFCNFIYGHQSSHDIRESLFKRLNEYKTVVSPGRYLNNIGTRGCSWKEKHDYLTSSKFTIACDSVNYPGFVTEKIVDPFHFNSIPIYFGSTRINEDFNEKAFVWCKNKDDIERVVDIVRELDNDDNAYIEMLMQPKLLYDNQINKLYSDLEDFLLNIFNGDVDSAGRRIKYFRADEYEKHLNKFRIIYNKTPKFIRKLFNY